MGGVYNLYMFRNNKFVSKNYYVSPYPGEHLEALQKRNILLSAAALLLYIPILVFWIYPGLQCAAWLSGAYEAVLAIVALYILGGIGLIFCNINNFFGYKIRKEVKQKDAPLMGFKKMSYNGQLITAVLVAAFAVFVLVIFIGHNVSRAGKAVPAVVLPGSIAIDVIVLILSLLSAAATWAYYIFAFKANKNMQYVRVDKDEEKKEPKKERKSLPMFTLTKEEIEEASKVEIVRPETDEESDNKDNDK